MIEGISKNVSAMATLCELHYYVTILVDHHRLLNLESWLVAFLLLVDSFALNELAKLASKEIQQMKGE